VSAVPPRVIVREYRGRQQKDANAGFARDAATLAQAGYFPTTQSWAQGQWGCGAYLLGLLAILLFGIGLLVLLYLVIVKPDGTLTVTYELRTPA
jgi:hypothetical protein